MFAVELVFDDGVSPNELVIVRRQSFVLGSTQDADVMLEGSSGAIAPIRIERRRGRRFAVIPLEDDAEPQLYSGESQLRIGEVTLRVIPIDIDLVIAGSEEPEVGPGKVLGRALCKGSPEYPALEFFGASSCVVSFAPDQNVLIGRSRSCAVRLDDQGIQPEHARIRFIGRRNALADFSFEPLAVGQSFLSLQEPLETVVQVEGGQSIILSPGKCSVRFLIDEEEQSPPPRNPKPSQVFTRYPCIVSRSELMKPDRYPLSIGRRVSIGRDPSNEIWFNASHVSRLHAELIFDLEPGLEQRSQVSITDHSSNGTFIDGNRLPPDVPRILPEKLTVVDFSKGISFAICYSAEEEEQYLGRKPALPRRGSSLQGQILSQIQIPLTPFNSDEEPATQIPSWFQAPPTPSDPEPNHYGRESYAQFSSPETENTFEKKRENNRFEPIEGYTPGAPQPESTTDEVEEAFAPHKKIGTGWTVVFYVLLAFLLVLHYFIWFRK